MKGLRHKPLLFFLLISLCTGFNATGQIVIPAIPEIPDSLSSIKKEELVTKKGLLVERKINLKTKIVVFNEKCGSVVEGSDKEKECAEEQSVIRNDKTKLRDDINKFIDEIASLKECLSARKQRDSLMKDQLRLTMLKEKVNDNINDLKKWKNDLNKYKNETEKIRTDVSQESLTNILGTLSDVLGLIPGAEKLEKLGVSSADALKVEKYRNHTKALAYFLNSAYSLYRLSSGQAEQINDQVETLLTLHNGILAIPGMPDDGQKAIEATSKIVEGISKLMVYASDPHPDQSKWDVFCQCIAVSFKPSMEVVGIFAPTVGAAVAGEGLAERGVNQYIKHNLQQSIDILQNAVSRNFEAAAFLERKTENIDAALAANNLTINDDNKKIENCVGN